MYIYSVWATRTYSGDEAPELVTAWDEYCVEGNPEGFEEDWKKGVAAMGDDVAEVRHIRISVPHEHVVRAFADTQIEGTIT